MDGQKSLLFICTVAAIWLLLPPAQAIVAAPGDLVYICTAGGAQEHPDIDGNRVAWEDSRLGRYIYCSDTHGGGEQRITNEDLDHADQRNPSISGDVIAWQDRRHGNWEIYLFSRSGGERRITNSTTNQQMPVVCRDHIAWYDTRRGYLDICLYNIETGRETYLDCSPVTEWRPAISEEYVVWEEASGGGDIWAYNIRTGKKRQITRDDARQTYPAISGSLIAWEDYRNGESDIYIFDLDAGREQRITDSPAAQVSPAISGDLLAWEDKRDGIWEIYICDLSMSAEVQMSLAPTGREQVYPAVSGNRIVWQSGRNSQSDIYGFLYTRERLPVAEFSAEPIAGAVPLLVSFTDLSSGDPETRAWDLGDGKTLTGQNPLYTYEVPGEYTVSLTVSNRFGSDTVTKTALIRAAPPIKPLKANFTANMTRGPGPLSVAFTDRTDGAPDSWLWDFGDGGSSHEQNPAHVYHGSGDYIVSLNVSDGTVYSTKTMQIQVIDPPVAGFSASPLDGTAPLHVAFIDASTGGSISWLWDFGDGATSVEQSPVHTYTSAGNYTIRLTVDGAMGNSTVVKEGYISVSPAPATPAPAERTGGSGGGGSARPIPERTTVPVQTTDTATPGDDHDQRDRSSGVVSPDGTTSLVVAEGTRIPDDAKVTIKAPGRGDIPLAPDAHRYTGHACIVESEGISLTSPATLAFSLTAGEWAAFYGGEKELVVQYYNRSAGAWEVAPTDVHQEGRDIKATVSHPGLYALFVRAPPDDLEEVAVAAAGPDPAYMQLAPGLFAFTIAGIAMLIYFRGAKP